MQLQGRHKRKLRENLTAYGFILPQLIFFTLFLIYPVLEGFRLSLFDVSVFDKIFVGFDNYKALFQNEIFYKAVKNTLIMVLWTTIITISAGFFVSSSIFDKKKGYITFIRGCYYIPTIMSMVVYGMIWKWMLNPSFGIVYYILGKFGIKDLNLLGNHHYVLYVLIILICIMNIGQAIILYVASMQGIDVSVIESAKIDGASRGAFIKAIVYPLVKPTTLYLVVINIIGVMKVFVIVNVMTSGGPNYASSSLMYLCYTEAFKSYNQGRAAAIGVVMFVITFFISLIPFRIFGGKDRANEA
jgi:multiple sugar transport system permease protein